MSMQQTPVSSNNSERSIHNQNNKNDSEDPTLSIGSANTLRRAMTVNKLSDMLDCIKDMKLYAGTIEKDLPDYLDALHINRKNEMDAPALEEMDDFIQLAKEQRNDSRYILLHDLIEQKKKSNKSQMSHSTKPHHHLSVLDKQVESMKRVIAAQPSALDAIYLETLLNSDQWQYNHQLLQTSPPMDILTPSERKRLDELLRKLE